MFDEVQDRGQRNGSLFAETKFGTVANDSPQQTTTSLLSGILGDLQHLVEQQFQLTRREIEDEVRQRAIAAAVFALGAAILFLGANVFCFGLVHLLHWASLPRGADPAWLPLWACHGMMAAMLAIAGGWVMHVGRVKFRSTSSFHSPLAGLLQERCP